MRERAVESVIADVRTRVRGRVFLRVVNAVRAGFKASIRRL